jgi:hypothetical protein
METTTLWSSILGLEALEGVNLEVLNQGVELVLGVLIFVLLSADSHTDLSGNVSDTGRPEESVKAGVNTHVLQTVLDMGSEIHHLSTSSGSFIWYIINI